LTAIIVSLSPILAQFSRRDNERKTRSWMVGCLSLRCCDARSAMATYPSKLFQTAERE
jgi:hypothetical protein